MKQAQLQKISKLQSRQTYTNSESPLYSEAYARVISKIEGSIENEKNFNREWMESLKKQDEDEKKKEDVRAAMNRHYFKQLKEQIEERETNRFARSQPRSTEPEFVIEQGYVWKGMNRQQWREILDGQIRDKKQISAEIKKREIERDRKRVEIAQQSLEEEVKKTEVKKKMIQNDMWESWERTREVKNLQRELEKIRRCGQVDSLKFGGSPGRRTGDYLENIVKGYENTFGKIKTGESASTAGKMIVSSRRIFRRKSKESLLNTSSYTNASIKLGDLIKEEEELKLKKNELIKVLGKKKYENNDKY